MIRGIWQLGRFSIEKSDFLESTVKLVRGKKYIVKINFDTLEEDVSVDFEEYDESKARKYLHVKLSSSRGNQFESTFRDIVRLEGNGKRHSVWISIIDEMEKLGLEVPEELRKVEAIFYENNMLKNEFREKVKKAIGKLLKKKDIAFYTIEIDGKPISDMDYYREFLTKIAMNVSSGTQVICYLCGKHTDNYITGFQRLPLKFYINDKIGFSQGLSDSWEGNFVVCEDCYMYLFSGQREIENRFSGKLGRMNYLLIPEFADDSYIRNLDIDELSEKLKNYYNIFHSLEDIEKILKDMYHVVEGYFNVTYVIYEKNNQQLNVFGIIKDVPKGRIHEIFRKLYEIFKEFKQVLDERFVMKSLSEIYHIVPLRISSDGKLLGIQKLVEIYDAIINEYYVDQRGLIEDFVRCIGAKYHGIKKYHNVYGDNSKRDIDVSYVLKTNQLLKLLGKAGGSVMHSGFPRNYEDYVEKAGFDEKEIALFLLGTVIADIGHAQISKYGRKPILDKINFQGMHLERLKILYNDVQEKVHQLKLYHLESILSRSRELFDRNLKSWDLNPFENVYYILSGYAFRNALNRKEEIHERR